MLEPLTPNSILSGAAIQAAATSWRAAAVRASSPTERGYRGAPTVRHFRHRSRSGRRGAGWLVL